MPPSKIIRYLIGLMSMPVLLLGWCEVARAQLEFEAAPIHYEQSTPENPITKLQARLDRGEIEFEYDAQHGYLPAVLEELGISQSSQTLVFSQTSLQLRKISPHRPRALYFNDDTYVGWVQNGDVVEISTADPNLGTVFYSLEQMPATSPKFIRDRGQCLICHASSRTQHVPGHLLRSIFPDAVGRGVTGTSTYITDQRSPFEDRWGGWYVTGKHGEMRHMGNVIASVKAGREHLDQERGANVESLKGFVSTKPYLTPHSDIVALMVLAHQTQMHNFITLANFETRQALHYNQVMNKALERPEEFQSDSTQRRITAVRDKLLNYLLFVDEFPLTDQVEGTSDFAREFSALGPHDGHGRSLRQLNLKTRLLEYPCSYLIYSDSFQALPAEVKQPVFARLDEVLTATTTDDDFAHLSLAQRKAIREILLETSPEFKASLSLEPAKK